MHGGRHSVADIADHLQGRSSLSSWEPASSVERGTRCRSTGVAKSTQQSRQVQGLRKPRRRQLSRTCEVPENLTRRGACGHAFVNLLLSGIDQLTHGQGLALSPSTSIHEHCRGRGWRSSFVERGMRERCRRSDDCCPSHGDELGLLKGHTITDVCACMALSSASGRGGMVSQVYGFDYSMMAMPHASPIPPI